MITNLVIGSASRFKTQAAKRQETSPASSQKSVCQITDSDSKRNALNCLGVQTSLCHIYVQEKRHS